MLLTAVVLTLLSSAYCDLKHLEHAASELLKDMDLTADPCDDFYQFACGGYLQRRTIPDDKTNVGVFYDIRDKLVDHLKELMERNVDDSKPQYIKMIKNLYDSCMNTKHLDEAGSEPLTKLLNSLGGWPVVEGDSWDASKFDWVDTIHKLRHLGMEYNMMVSMGVTRDFKNSTIHLVAVDQAHLGMPDRQYLLNGLSDSATKAYFNFMEKAAIKLGASAENAKKELMDALYFERDLAVFSASNEERRNFTSLYNIYYVRQLQKLAPQVNWLKFLNGLLNEQITDEERVMVLSPKYIKSFSEFIANTDKRTIANYIIWRVVASSASDLSKEWRDLAHEYSAQISGLVKEKPRSEQCTNLLSQSLGIALSAYYVQNYFSLESANKANDLVKFIREEFLQILENLDWMDDATKTEAKEKLHGISTMIGYPEELMKDTLISDYYKNITVTSDKYFDNILNINKWAIELSMSDLRKIKQKGEWTEYAVVAIVNAFYSPLENAIIFPAGILQEPFFGKDRPAYMNFGGIGTIIGHEITHGFDDQGRGFDKNGNNRNWWGEETNTHFQEKAQCIAEQYGNYTADNGMKLNGQNTLGENIADNGGMKEAYRAYQQYVKVHGTETTLPGMKYNPNQLFWISAANVWCAKYRPEHLKLLILADTHSPSRFRVIGPMSNLPEFSKDFNCPIGSAMNPKEKCEVW